MLGMLCYVLLTKRVSEARVCGVSENSALMVKYR
jgi:hypothetical protein